METYLHIIPKELNVEILSYFTDAVNISNFVHTFRLNIDNKDWIYLISKGYSKYYKPSISKYDAEKIYLALLYLYADIIIDESLEAYNNNVVDITLVIGELILLIKEPPDPSFGSCYIMSQLSNYNKLNLYELFKYLMLESTEEERMEYQILTSSNALSAIIAMDDLDTYKQIGPDPIIDNEVDVYDFISDYVVLMIEYNAHKTLKYFLKYNFEEEDNAQIKELIIEVLENYSEVDKKTVDIIFDSGILDMESMILTTIYDVYPSQEYLLERLPEKLPNGDLEFLVSKLIDYLKGGYITWFIFNNVWKKYSAQFTDEQITWLYRAAYKGSHGNDDSDDYLKILTLMAQSDVIKKMFLTDV